jgi:hypothetical protein
MDTPINDGGPAFPLQSIGPEFPPGYCGMTLRDWFAGQALIGMCSNPENPINPPASHEMNLSWYQFIAQKSYQIADAMLEARKGGEA